MPILQIQPEVSVPAKASRGRHTDEEGRAIFEGLLPMLIVLGLWLFAQVWLMGPLLFRN